MLCYSWNRLDQGRLIDVSAIPTTELVDLFALVLVDGLRHLEKRGLQSAYIEITEDLSGIRGRVDISTSLRRSLFARGQAHCRYDELTTNTLSNQIVKASLRALLRIPALDGTLRKRVAHSLIRLSSIQDITLREPTFSSNLLAQNSRFYRFLLNVCELLYQSYLLDENTGDVIFRDFTRDDAKMALVFQNFLSNFIARECSGWSVKSENIDWQASSSSDPLLRMLPRMQTDISLSRRREYIIVDAKYYREALSSHYGVEKLRGAHLYQLLAYLQNSDQHDVLASGMLIYPQNGRALHEQYTVLGRLIQIRTLDLSKPWQSIDNALRQIFAR